MLLTEEHAMRLFREWTQHCDWIAPAPPTLVTPTPFTHPGMVVSGIRDLQNCSDEKEHALGIRRAMEGMNALAACAGFDPEENPTFWRRQLGPMAARPGVLPGKLLRLTSEALSRYDVICDFHNAKSSSNLAYGLAICLAMEEASPAMQAREHVHAQLRRYLITPPPPLHLAFGLPFARVPATTVTWEKFTDTIHDLAHMRSLRPVSEGILPLKCVVGREALAPLPVDDPNEVSDSLIEATKLKMVEVHELHSGGYLFRGDLDLPYAELATRLRDDLDESYTQLTTQQPLMETQQLLSSLCDTGRIKSMSWVLEADNAMASAALFSAVASIRSLKSLSLEVKRAGTANNAYEWLAFALRRRQLNGWPLSLCTNFDSAGDLAFTNAMRPEQKFGCLIPDVVREMAVLEYLPLGTTAMPAKHTDLTQELLVDRDCQRDVFIPDRRRVDVLVRSDLKSIIIIPGSGLFWIRTDALRSWGRPPERVPRLVLPAFHAKVRANSDLIDATRAAEVVISGSKSVAFLPVTTGRTDLSFAPLKRLAKRSSAVRSLQLPGTKVQRLGKIITGVAGGASKIEALSIESLNGPLLMSTPSPFFDAITDSNSPTHRTLQDLRVLSAILSRECVESLAARLATNRRLRFLQLRTDARLNLRPILQQRFAARVGPTERSKMELYAFLLAMRRSPRWQVLPCESQRLVLAFAVVYAQREVLFE